ncbi:MAG: hypothetical protein EPN17_17990 [Methylobacter sp.]|nr:MAG: hypothetical protein EPN17_17990 [Methylobacter sp.]
MAKFKTHYDSLNVSRNAPASVIKAAYKALCQNYHPDKYAGGHEEALRIMKVINGAYAVLSDSAKRAEHDRWIDKQERAHASNEAQRMAKIITNAYVDVTAKKPPSVGYLVTINKFWKNACYSVTKALRLSLSRLGGRKREKQTNWIFWLAGVVVAIVLVGIILYVSDSKTTTVATTAAVNQEVAGMLEKARRMLNKGRVVEALSLYLPLAEQGNADAQFHVGLLYANGLGVTKDDKQAADWFGRAAKQGHREAQTKLGFMYATGKGVTQNYNTAVYWCYQAAEQGDVIAQYNLGLMYAKGQGVAQDNRLAISWYSKAAAQGHARAQYNLGVIYANGVGVPKDSKQAADLYRKAAKQGLAEAVAALKQLEHSE